MLLARRVDRILLLRSQLGARSGVLVPFMKKPVRLLFFAGGLLGVLLVVVVALACSTGVQTWAARRVLVGLPGVKGGLGQATAGFQSIALSDLTFEQFGAVITMPTVVAELSVVDASWSRKVNVRRLVARGWTIDLTHYHPPLVAGKSVGASAPVGIPAAVATEIFQGIFARAALPFDLSIDGVELEGDVKLPLSPDFAAGSVHVVLTGGGLAAGREGAFRFKITAALAGADVPVNSLVVAGRLVAAMDSPRTFERLATQAEAAASGRQFPKGVSLNVDVAATRAASGENYFISLFDGVRVLASLKLALPFGSRHLAGTWRLDLRDTDLSPFTLGRPLPIFMLVGDGGVEVETAVGEMRATGKLSASADKLGVVQSELSAFGAVKLSTEFDIARRGDSFRVERLSAAIAGAQPILGVVALQPFDFNAKSGELKVADPARDLLGLSLHGMPLAWAKPWLKNYSLSGGDLKGELVARAHNGGFSLRTKSSLTAPAVSLAQSGEPRLNAVDFSLNASADYTPHGWQIELAPFTAVIGSVVVLGLDAKAGQLRGEAQPVKTTGRFVLNLPGALSQPALAGAVGLTSGDASGEFVASVGARQEIQAKLAVANLVADPRLTKEKLPAVTTEVRADVGANGVVTLNLPLLIERNGRKSDLTFVGTVTPGKGGLTVAARVVSSLLVIDDAQILSAVFTPNAGVPGAAGAQVAPRPVAPPWAGINGQVELGLKEVIYSELFRVSDMTGTISLAAGEAKMVNFRAGLGEGAEAKVNGGLTFDAKSTAPYALTADLAVNEFDPSSLFKAINPGQPATVEGKFSVASKLFGRAITLAELATTTHGDFELASKGGVFRGLPVNYAARVETVGKISAGAAAIGNLLSSVTGKKDYSDIANKAQAAAEMSKTLAAIPYDQLNVVFRRDAAMNHTLKDFSLIAPELRIAGTGQTSGGAGAGLLAQSLTMEFKLRARGRAAELIKYLGKLDTTTDDLGYAGCSLPLKIGGTLGKPDPSELNRALANLALEKSGVTDKASELLNKLIGGGK